MAPRLRLTQSGGFGGLEMVAEVDIEDLPAADAAKVRGALAGIDFDSAKAKRSGPPGGPDRFQYDLEVTDGGRRSLTAHEPDLTPDLQAVIDVLLPLARPQ